jgi:transposase
MRMTAKPIRWVTAGRHGILKEEVGNESWIKLHFIPAYCPHLNPIERLWGVMHRNVTH